jgi:hypothetical protein
MTVCARFARDVPVASYDVRAALRLRQVVNAVTLATPAGLLVAVAGGARPRRGPGGLLLAPGYRLPVPPAPAFTVGNVVVVRAGREDLLRRSRVLRHEARHATQYACCGGLPMVPLYLVAAAWSWLRCGDPASYNAFERLAGLADGGYRLPGQGGARASSPH